MGNRINMFSSWLKWNDNKLNEQNQHNMKYLRYGVVTIPNTICQLRIKYISRVIHRCHYSNHLIFRYNLPFSSHTCIIFWKEMMISNQVTHESIFIYEHNGWSQSNDVKSSRTNQYSSMQYDHWLVLPLTMMINCKLKLAPSKKENHITFYITKISICICIEI